MNMLGLYGPNAVLIARLADVLRGLGPGEQRLVIDAQYGAVLDSPHKQQQAAADRVAYGVALDQNRGVNWFASIDAAWEAADDAVEKTDLAPKWPFRLAARFAAEALVVGDLLEDGDYQILIGPATATATLHWLRDRP